MGCLLASARAANGALVVPQDLPEEANFKTPPPEETEGGWHIVSCPSPHLDRPRTTLGLGDTFMAGSLLVLGTGDTAAGECGSGGMLMPFGQGAVE